MSTGSTGWPVFYQYRYDNADYYTRFTHWISTTWWKGQRYYLRFGSTSNNGYFSWLYNDHVTAMISPTWMKILPIFCALTFFTLITWWYFEGRTGNADVQTEPNQSPNVTMERMKAAVSDSSVDRAKTDYSYQMISKTDAMFHETDLSRFGAEQKYHADMTTTDQVRVSNITQSRIKKNLMKENCSTCQSHDCKEFEFRWPVYTSTNHHTQLQVYLSGSFFGWSSKVLMTKRETARYQRHQEEFFIKLNLPKGHHEFKFFVDGVWRVSNEYGKCRNQLGEDNNYINNAVAETKFDASKCVVNY